MNLEPRILVAGAGNILKGDDGFGVKVIHRLFSRKMRDNVQVIDFGIRGLDLAYTLLDGKHDFVIFVDIAQRGEVPGTLFLIEPDMDPLGFTEGVGVEVNPHGMHPVEILKWVKAMGGELCPIRLLACEPFDVEFSEGEFRMGLSNSVEDAVEPAVEMIEELIEEFLCTN